ncbi:MAG: Do family serine endopeptidase [Spirochaetes bacterium]|nr:Do family serine endopeptidase [Spirochaetota bacterium]MBU1079286.1 Do family serine endopeptidase [Spirochaetota bacterium]
MSLTRKLFSRKFFFVNLVLVGIMIGFVAAFAILAKAPASEGPAIAHAESSPARSVDAATAITQAKAIQSAFNNVANLVLPSVVELSVIGTSTQPQSDQFPWRFFFGDPNQAPEEKSAPKEFEERGLGSGIIVRKDGKKVYVLTNNHVVAGAKDITVKLFDEREFKGAIAGIDIRRDLAVVSFESGDASIRPATLGDSDALQVGDWAIAIGSPFGLFSSVTAGIVSAIGRDGGPEGNISDFIQTDASINRGNSGGALANIDGQVIGINTWIASTTGGSVGLGFSIPINNAVKVIDDIISKGTVRYGWLGVLLSDVARPTLGELGLGDKRGAFIGHVFSDGPAAKGGLKPGDFVTAIDGKTVSSLDQLVRIVGDLAVGSKAAFKVLRDGKPVELKVTIDERKESSAADYSKLWPGLEVSALDKDAAEAASLPKGTKGVVVTSVIAKSPAAALGIQLGDVVTGMNDGAVDGPADFYRALNDARSQKFQFTILRGGQTMTTLALVRK